MNALSTSSAPAPVKPRYARTVGRAAWEIGWDGKRPVEAHELAAMAGVQAHQLYIDQRRGLLGKAQPAQPGVRVLIYSEPVARAYLKKKRPSALVFQKPLFSTLSMASATPSVAGA